MKGRSVSGKNRYRGCGSSCGSGGDYFVFQPRAAHLEAVIAELARAGQRGRRLALEGERACFHINKGRIAGKPALIRRVYSESGAKAHRVPVPRSARRPFRGGTCSEDMLGWM